MKWKNALRYLRTFVARTLIVMTVVLLLHSIFFHSHDEGNSITFHALIYSQSEENMINEARKEIRELYARRGGRIGEPHYPLDELDDAMATIKRINTALRDPNWEADLP